MANPHTIYLTGAGASFNALPIGAELSSKLRELPVKIAGLVDGTTFNDKFPKGVISDFETTCRELADQAAGSVTVDAFIRNIALTPTKSGQVDKYKAILSIYFAIEQRLVPPDPRYRHWFANVLIPGREGPTMPDGISVLTWNYDLQMPLAYCKAYGLTKIHKARKGLNEFSLLDATGDLDQPFIVHLNGIAEVESNGAYQLLDSTEESIQDTIEYSYAYYHDIVKNRTNSKNHLEFAWEVHEDKAKRMIDLCNRLKSVNTLICIGYSFPRFNRDRDKTILDAMVNLRQVVLQFPERTIQNMRPLVSGILRRDVEFVLNSECSTFHIV